MNILEELKWKYSTKLNKKIGSKVRNLKEINLLQIRNMWSRTLVEIKKTSDAK